MGIEQHFMSLAGVGHQPEGTTGTQLQVRDLDASEDAANQHPFLAPIKLKGLPQRERQRHKGAYRLALFTTPVTDEGGELAVAAVIPFSPDHRQQRLGAPAILLRPERIGPECLLQRLVKGTELVEHGPPLVDRLH
ncbi:hypothetical protein D3C78_1396720 [compost metagenome]